MAAEFAISTRRYKTSTKITNEMRVLQIPRISFVIFVDILWWRVQVANSADMFEQRQIILKQMDPDQQLRNVASDQGLDCLLLLQQIALIKT